MDPIRAARLKRLGAARSNEGAKIVVINLTPEVKERYDDPMGEADERADMLEREPSRLTDGGQSNLEELAGGGAIKDGKLDRARIRALMNLRHDRMNDEVEDYKEDYGSDPMREVMDELREKRNPDPMKGAKIKRAKDRLKEKK